MGQSKYPYIEFSGAVQQQTTSHIRKANEVEDAFNVDFTKKLGAFVRRDGSQKYDVTNFPLIPSSPVDNPALGAYIARYPTGSELWMASDVSGGATASVRRWDSVGLAWVNVQTGLPADAEYNFEYDLDEMWVSNYLASTDTIGTPFTVDQTHSVSQIRQLNFAPAARFYMEFNGSMWAANVQVGATRYRDRVYKSSGPTGVVAFARSAQTDVAAPVTLFDNVPTMTSDTAPVGTASASSIANAANDAFMAFDDNTTTDSGGFFNKWTANGTTGSLQYDFGSGITKTIVYYSVQAVEATGSTSANRAPKTWTFEGSNNGSSWTVLDTQTNVPAWTQLEKRTYTTTNATAYRYYRINITANQGATDFVIVVEMELLSSTTGVLALTANLDSARYVKPSQILDIYTAGTNTKNYTITVATVDKVNDAITWIPYQLNFATTDVNTSTEVITLSSTTNLPTGTTVRFASSGGLPAPLVAGTVYYVINTGTTTIKLATSLANAQLAVAINLSTTGSGTHTIYLSYVLGNKDEFWGQNRKGLLTRYWNTDYRDPTSADWIKLPATLDATNDITALGKIASRMFIWTENSTSKFDGTNLTLLYNDVGCIAQKTVCYYQSFMFWLDAKGQVWARNEEAGTQDVISTGIQKILARVPQALLKGATAVCVGKKYKLTLGTVTRDDGSTYTLRVVYDAEANTWTTEGFSPKMLVQLEYKYANAITPSFFDEHGNFWIDELGDDDATVIIASDVRIGEDNFQVDEIKSFMGIKVYSKNSAGTKISVTVDGGEPIEIGEIQFNVDSLSLKDVPNGTLLDVRFTDSSTGKAQEIHKYLVYYSTEQDTFRATKH